MSNTLLTDGFPAFYVLLLCTPFYQSQHTHTHTHAIFHFVFAFDHQEDPHLDGMTRIKPTQTSGLLMLTSVAFVSSEWR